MADRIDDNVGKKIVEALKMQASDVDLSKNEIKEDVMESVVDDSVHSDIVSDNLSSNNTSALGSLESESVPEAYEVPSLEPNINPEPIRNIESSAPFTHDSFAKPEISQPTFSASETFHSGISKSFVDEAFEQSLKRNNIPVMPQEGFELPSNVEVLNNLIAKLPAGVSKQTGAIIIKQTMEALGISMKNVIEEARQFQAQLSSQVKECQTSISEYKKQIGILENKSKVYQFQFSAMNDVISLFINTGV